MALDNIDQGLLSMLRADARTSVVELAKRLKVSRATVQNRIDNMQASGALLGFTVRVREDYGVDTVRALMTISVAGKSTTEIIRRLRRIPELTTLHTTNGAWDLVAEINVSSLA